MGMMSGKKGLVIGVANDHSYAWHISKSLIAHGAEVMFTHLPGEKMERRVRAALEEGLGLDNPWLAPLDARDDQQIESVFASAAEHNGGELDFLVHSIAFADRTYLEVGKFADTPKEVFTTALEISAYSLLAMGRAARSYMLKGGSIVGMTYYGAEKVIPGYNVMGVAKACLEATCRYLAAELGSSGIRVNTISGGPLRTLSAMGVGRFSEMLDIVAQRSPLGRNIEGAEVGDTAAWLLSDMSMGITGQTLYVDAGYSIMGM